MECLASSSSQQFPVMSALPPSDLSGYLYPVGCDLLRARVTGLPGGVGSEGVFLPW